jgi:exosome complex RNA-binding protein Rrp42 (RNase PH superfamily)
LNVLDATPAEELCAEVRLFVSVNPFGQICTITKEGPGGFDPSSLGDMLDNAQAATKDLFSRMDILMKQQKPLDSFVEFIR